MIGKRLGFPALLEDGPGQAEIAVARGALPRSRSASSARNFASASGHFCASSSACACQ